jgi:hypothetical protein
LPETSRHTLCLSLLGADFSKPAGLPPANQLLEQVPQAVRHYAGGGGTTHLDDALFEYQQCLDVAQPDEPFDIEEFGAWLDWANTLALDSTECDSGVALETRQRPTNADETVSGETCPPLPGSIAPDQSGAVAPLPRDAEPKDGLTK